MNRQGATLLEVLVAIFVMGIGLLALLTLFPLGALRMAAAIQDDRCAQSGRCADAIATAQGVRNDAYVFNDPNNDPTVTNPFIDPKWTAAGLAAGLKTADPDGPSFPVIVDPAGVFTTFGLSSQNWLSSSTDTIRRRNVSFVNTNRNNVLRWFTLLDDVLFDVDSTPKYVGVNIQRDIRYTWAYMLKRPKSSNASVVDMTVVIFNKRALTISGNLDLNESLYQTVGGLNEVSFDVGRNSITLSPNTATNQLPPVRPGDWLLDASYIGNATNTFGTANANFYRVIGINEVAAANPTIEYEVQPELRNIPPAGTPNVWRKVIHLDGVAEVMEKGTGRVP